MAAHQEPLPGDSKHKRNKSIISFESWMIRKAPGLEGREKSWTNVEREPIRRNSDDLADDVQRKGKSGMDALLALTTIQQRHVNSLVEDKQYRERQPGAEWSWVLIHLDFVGRASRGVKRASKDARAICVTLQRTVKIADSGPSTTKDLDESLRKVNLHGDSERVVQVPGSQEDHRGFTISAQPPDGGHQRPGTFQDQLHMPQPNAPGSASVLQMGDPPVSQRWPQDYRQSPHASDHPESQHAYPPPPLGPGVHPLMNHPGPQRTAEVGNPLAPVDIPRLFDDSRYPQYSHLRGDGTFHSRDGSQYAGSGRDSGVFPHMGLPDPQVEPPDIEGWRNESTGRTYIPHRQDRVRKDLDDSPRTRRGNKYYKKERFYHPDSQSARYYKNKGNVVQPATTRRRSPRDDNRHRESRPHRRDRRLSPRVSQRDRQESFSRSPPSKHRHHRDRPRSPSPSDGRRGRDRTSRRNRSYIPDDDYHSSEHSSRSSSASLSPAPKPRRARDRSAERRDDYSPTRTSRKERREYKRREISPGPYRR